MQVGSSLLLIANAAWIKNGFLYFFLYLLILLIYQNHCLITLIIRKQILYNTASGTISYVINLITI